MPRFFSFTLPQFVSSTAQLNGTFYQVARLIVLFNQLVNLSNYTRLQSTCHIFRLSLSANKDVSVRESLQPSAIYCKVAKRIFPAAETTNEGGQYLIEKDRVRTSQRKVKADRNSLPRLVVAGGLYVYLKMPSRVYRKERFASFVAPDNSNY